ncbi:MAG: lysylphosphatidylglycerol synthase domain-containing protein [Gaiellaceae bacterium]
MRRSSAIGLALLGAAAVAVAALTVGRGTLLQAVATLGRLQPDWLLLGGAGFGTALVCSALAWNAGLRACGGCASSTDVAARYAIGSLVNSVSPAHLGGAVRIGLLSRTLDGGDPVLRTCGVGAAVAAARALALAALVFGAAVVGRVPLWPAPLVALVVAGALALCVRSSRRVAGRLAAALEIFRSPGTGLEIGRWVACSFAARLGATIAVVAALGIPHALSVSIVLLAAVALAGVLPLTPGNIGAGAGAATLALHGTGVGTGVALGLGMAFQAVETCTAILLGLAGSALVAAPGTRQRRWSLVAVGIGAFAVAASVGFASVDLV